MDRGTDIARRSPRTQAKHLVRWAGVVFGGRPELAIPHSVQRMRGMTAECFFA
ncbi:hypothetical protein ACWCQW_41995 [Streptomyces mirabilis]